MKTVANLGSIANEFSVKERLAMIKAAGFDGADITLCGPQVALLEGDYLAAARDVRAEADRLGLPILQAHAPFDSTTAYAEEKLELTKRSIEFAGICGAHCIVVHPIQHLSYFDDPKNAEILFEYNMEFYGKLKDVADRYGIRIATENMWRTNKMRQVIDHSVCSRPEEFCRYVDELQRLYGNTFTGCLDLGHTVLVGVDPCQMIGAMGHRVGALHVHDNDYHKDLHLAPGLGSMNYNAITAALKEIGYKGHFTLECHASSLDRAGTHLYLQFLAGVSRQLADKSEGIL